MQNPTLQIPSGEPKEVSAAASLIPYRRDDERCKYLGYLACGFSDEEALYVLGLTRDWLADARLDGKFTDLEERIPELRKVLSREYTELDFYRNFRMVLEKDHRVLRTSLGMEIDPETEEPVELTAFDQQYLLRMRSAYTPQQLQLLEAIAGSGDGGFNFAKYVKEHRDEIIGVSRTESVLLAGGQGAKTPDDS